MTHDVETLTLWIRICLGVAAISTTSFPFLYMFSSWHHSYLGRFVMLQSISFAVAMDLTFIFQFWNPTNILLIFWINAIVFSLIALSTAGLSIMMARANYFKWKDDDGQGTKRSFSEQRGV